MGTVCDKYVSFKYYNVSSIVPNNDKHATTVDSGLAIENTTPGRRASNTACMHMIEHIQFSSTVLFMSNITQSHGLPASDSQEEFYLPTRTTNGMRETRSYDRHQRHHSFTINITRALASLLSLAMFCNKLL